MESKYVHAHLRHFRSAVAFTRRRAEGLPRALLLFAVASLVWTFGNMPARAAETPTTRPAFASGYVLVAKNPASRDLDFLTALTSNRGNTLGQLRGLDVHVVGVPAGSEEATIARLARNPHVTFAEVDALVEPSGAATDPGYASEWHLPKIGAPAAWDLAVGSGITIAILDTGVDGTHPDLAARLVPGWNVYDNNSNTSDVYGHGTSVAGAAAAAMNNGVGIAGVAGSANIMPVRISDTTGYALWSTIAQGVTWAADHRARVANISYSVAGSSSVISAANYFRSKGGVVAVSAGNTGAVDYTAPTSAMLVVAATDSSDARASFSTYGSFVSLSAPGVSIYTTANGGGYRYASGTSFSSPIVAGVAALILSRRPDYSPSQVEALLKSTATDLGSVGTDVYYGAGRVNAAAALQTAAVSGAGDAIAPVVAIASPTGGSVAGSVAVAVNATDNVGVTRVELRVNGVTVATDTVAPFQFSWNSAGIADGTARLTAVAYDAAGNTTTSAIVTVTVANATSTADTTAPAVSIATPNTTTTPVSGTITVSINATDNVAVTKVELRVNGLVVASGNIAPYAYAWNTNSVADGTATLTATAYDAAGNSRVSTAVNVKVANDTIAPVLAFTTPYNGAVVSGNMTIATSVSDNSGAAGITQSLFVDGTLKAAVTGKALDVRWNSRTAPAGLHTLTVTARDASGNTTTQQIQVTSTGG